MADLYLGRTMTYGFHFISDGAANTFTLPFPADLIRCYNYTKFATAGQLVESIWFRDFPAGDALQIQVIADNGATANKNCVLETTNGFTEANTTAGVTADRATITGITAATPPVVTAAAHGFTDGQLVRITKVVGMTEVNNNLYKVNNATTNTFELQDPVTDEDIVGAGFTTYSSGGQANMVSRSGDDLVVYNGVTYKMTFGSAVMANDSDVIYVECVKFGNYENVGDVA